ncbi:TPA: hypothetical protein ACF372_004723, partial [Vibrio parahaemolyticus]
LSGEQRRPLDLKYCTVNIKFKVNQKCQALGIRLKRFVIRIFPIGSMNKIKFRKLAISFEDDDLSPTQCMPFSHHQPCEKHRYQQS